MSKKRKKKTKKSNSIDWVEVLVQFLTGLLTGIILLCIDKLFF